jgi:group I intron endonuclease
MPRTLLTAASGVTSFAGKDLRENKPLLHQRSGVYALLSPSGKTYVGSSQDLWNRLSDYSQPWFVAKYGRTLPVGKALVKYGFGGMTVILLSYTAVVDLLPAEQAAIDLYKPEYNVLATAGSTRGHKHTPASKELMRLAKLGTKASDAAKASISLAQKGLSLGREVKAVTRALIAAAQVGRTSPHAHQIEVLDLRTGLVGVFNGYAKTAAALGVGVGSVRGHVGRSTLRGYALRFSSPPPSSWFSFDSSPFLTLIILIGTYTTYTLKRYLPLTSQGRASTSYHSISNTYWPYV